MWQKLTKQILTGDFRSIARSISLVENEHAGYREFMEKLPSGNAKIIGITGPPGAGKSSITDAMIERLTQSGQRVAVICIDPSSPFNFGAILGDRIRMSNWFNHPDVYIRSLASRGSLGGLHPMIIEITDILKAAPFDLIIIETVGIGQSEVEIAGLADVTVVVVVPEAGDEIQTMKAGMMEIADIFVVNKSDRPDADQYVRNLRMMLAPAYTRQKHEIPVIKTVATSRTGIDELTEEVLKQNSQQSKEKKIFLLASKAWHIIQRLRMKDVDPQILQSSLAAKLEHEDFNLFQFIKQFEGARQPNQ